MAEMYRYDQVSQDTINLGNRGGDEKTAADYGYEFLNNLLFGLPDFIGKATSAWTTTEDRAAQLSSEGDKALNDAMINYYEKMANNVEKQIEEYQKQTEAYIKSIQQGMDKDEARQEVNKAYSDLTSKITDLLNKEKIKAEKDANEAIRNAESYDEMVSSINSIKSGRSTFSSGRQKLEQKAGEKGKLRNLANRAANEATAKVQNLQATADDLINQVSSGATEGLKEKLISAGDLINQSVDVTPIQKAESKLSNIINGGAN